MGVPINIKYHKDYVEFCLTNKRSPDKQSQKILADIGIFEKHINNTKCWFLKNESKSEHTYVARSIYPSCKTLFLHNLVLEDNGIDSGGLHMVCDHINRNRHDNRIKNLRLVDRKTNRINSDKLRRNGSEYKGFSIIRCLRHGKVEGYYATLDTKYICYAKTKKQLILKLDKLLKGGLYGN